MGERGRATHTFCAVFLKQNQQHLSPPVINFIFLLRIWWLEQLTCLFVDLFCELIFQHLSSSLEILGCYCFPHHCSIWTVASSNHSRLKTGRFFFISVHLLFRFLFKLPVVARFGWKIWSLLGLESAVCGIQQPDCPSAKPKLYHQLHKPFSDMPLKFFSIIILTKREIMEFGATGKLHPWNSKQSNVCMKCS